MGLDGKFFKSIATETQVNNLLKNHNHQKYKNYNIVRNFRCGNTDCTSYSYTIALLTILINELIPLTDKDDIDKKLELMRYVHYRCYCIRYLYRTNDRLGDDIQKRLRYYDSTPSSLKS